MAHPLHHAESSAHKWDGEASDYQAIHDWFDGSKAHYAGLTHRAMRHHAAGIFDAERVFGLSVTTSTGRVIPVRWIAEQHVREDCQGRIPSLGDWMSRIHPAPWMGNGSLKGAEDTAFEGDGEFAWRQAVMMQRTTMGLSDWLVAQDRSLRNVIRYTY